MKLRLTRKLAEFVDGVDLRGFEVGEVIDLPITAANLLIAEGWAAPVVDQLSALASADAAAATLVDPFAGGSPPMAKSSATRSD